LGSVSGRTVLTYHRLYDGRGFSPVSRSWNRYQALRALLEETGLGQHLEVVSPPLATAEDVTPVHPEAYVEFVRAMDRRGTGFVDGRETPAWTGVLDRALAAVGGTLSAVERVVRGDAAHAFNPSGGLHHAHRERASGFCIFNDVALAVRRCCSLGLARVAVVDVDGHHGDGTQEVLYGEPVLHISLHQYDGRFYPGTGAVEEVGWGAGYGYTVNVPLPRSTGSVAYVRAFEAVVPAALRAFRPEMILLNFGVDGHHADPLVHLNLTTGTYRRIAAHIHALAHELCAGRLVAFGSGGYAPDAVARCWGMLLAELTESLPAGRAPWPAALACLTEPDLVPPGPAAAVQVEQVVGVITGEVLPLRLTVGAAPVP
jgi:acetoin utilization protein AcuC